MGFLKDYKKGMIASLDQEKLQEKIKAEEKREEERSEYLKEMWRESFQKSEDNPTSRGEDIKNAAPALIILALGCIFWIAVIVFLFKSCTGG